LAEKGERRVGKVTQGKHFGAGSEKDLHYAVFSGPLKWKRGCFPIDRIEERGKKGRTKKILAEASPSKNGKKGEGKKKPGRQTSVGQLKVGGKRKGKGNDCYFDWGEENGRGWREHVRKKGQSTTQF